MGLKGVRDDDDQDRSGREKCGRSRAIWQIGLWGITEANGEWQDGTNDGLMGETRPGSDLRCSSAEDSATSSATEGLACRGIMGHGPPWDLIVGTFEG